jgi:hypothetical protein
VIFAIGCGVAGSSTEGIPLTADGLEFWLRRITFGSTLKHYRIIGSPRNSGSLSAPALPTDFVTTTVRIPEKLVEQVHVDPLTDTSGSVRLLSM